MFIDCSAISLAERYRWLTSCIAPRPIALASTLDAKGKPNLSPFSFFNLFSSDPPMVIFAPLLRMRDASMKHTLLNIRKTKEVVIHICNEPMIQQVSLSSCEYPEGVDEFVKAGFGKLRSRIVLPYRIPEAPVALECRVDKIVSLGKKGGAGQLVIAEVVSMHVKDEMINSEGTGIDPYKMSFISRLGFDDYSVLQPESIRVIPKPNRNNGIGFDQLPESLLSSRVLTENDLALLAGVSAIPLPDPGWSDKHLEARLHPMKDPDARIIILHNHVQYQLAAGDIETAWQVILRYGSTGSF